MYSAWTLCFLHSKGDAMNGKDDGVVFITIRDNHIAGFQLSLNEEELLDICKKQNTLQLMIILDDDKED